MTVAQLKKPVIATKVAIVCGSPSTQHLVPYEDLDTEIWILGNRLDKYAGKRISRVFEIHDDDSEHGPGYQQWLVDQGYPLIVGERFKAKGDNVQTFPFESANELYGSEYLTSSTSYMVAYALLMGFMEIGIYGSDMSVDDHEYFWQRPCLEAWIGFAKGKGAIVHIPEISPIGKCDYVEGRNSGGKPEFAKPPFTQAGFLEMAATHSQKMRECTDQIRALEIKHAAHDGARQSYERLAKVARAVESGQTITSLSDTARVK